MNLKDEISELRALPKETEWVEFKENNSNLVEIGEYISALSNSAALHNEGFGYLVFGIEDETHRIVGTDFNPKIEKKGNEELENWLARLLNPRIDFRIVEGELEGENVVIFKIDATFNTPVKFRGEAFIRIGSYKKKLDEYPEKARKIWSRGRSIVFEQGYATDVISEDQVLEYIDFPGFFKLTKHPFPPDKTAILRKLEEEKIIKKTGKGYRITNLGGVLFTNDINHFDNLARKAVRVVVYDGNDRINAIKEQVGIRGYAIGFEGLISFINDQLPTSEEITGALRKELKIYPELAIRELVANAIIHQDFTVSGSSPMVEIFNNRLEITNPGKPLINTDRFIDHNPESRNEKLASIMRRIGICEERGSGIDKVIDQVEIFQLPAPEFIEGDNYTRVIVYAPKTLRQMNRMDKIRATYQHCCLRYVTGDIMSNQTLRKRFDVAEKNYSLVSRIIKETLKEELIKDYDPDSTSRKFARYVPFWA